MSYPILREYVKHLSHDDIMALRSTNSRMKKAVDSLGPDVWLDKVKKDWAKYVEPEALLEINHHWKQLYRFLSYDNPLTAMAEDGGYGYLAEFTDIYAFNYRKNDFDEAINVLLEKDWLKHFKILVSVYENVDSFDAIEVANKLLNSGSVNPRSIDFLSEFVKIVPVYKLGAQDDILDFVNIVYDNCDYEADKLVHIMQAMEKNLNWYAFFNPADSECQLEKAQVMLDENLIDPRAEKSASLRYAVQNNKLGLVKMLLKDGRANPQDAKNYALRHAAFEGHSEMVKLLIQDGRVNIHSQNDYPINAAAMYGHVGVVKILLAAGVKPSAVTEKTLTFCENYRGNSKNNCKEIKMLLNRK